MRRRYRRLRSRRFNPAGAIRRLLLAEVIGTSRQSRTGGIGLEKWATFATVSGGAAAGLTGLLFVAVSIRIDFIAKSQELRNRAAQTLALFVSVLFVAIVLSIPDQSYAALGVELLVVALIIGGSLLVLDRRARVAPSTSGTSTQAVALLLGE